VKLKEFVNVSLHQEAKNVSETLSLEFHKRWEARRRNREHPEVHRERSRRYYKEHRQQRVEYSRNYCLAHMPQYRECQRKYRQRLKTKVFTKLGNKCVRCGFSDPRALQIDHVHGGGMKELREISPSAYHKKVLADTEGNYQLLCANCNWIKKSENGESTRRKE
jgi:hypothetical protein